jgi:hypothetical protein
MQTKTKDNEMKRTSEYLAITIGVLGGIAVLAILIAGFQITGIHSQADFETIDEVFYRTIGWSLIGFSCFLAGITIYACFAILTQPFFNLHGDSELESLFSVPVVKEEQPLQCEKCGWQAETTEIIAKFCPQMRQSILGLLDNRRVLCSALLVARK